MSCRRGRGAAPPGAEASWTSSSWAARSPPARRCSCSGGACARIASRSSRSAFIVFLIVLAIAAPLVVKILGLPGPNIQNLNLTDAFGSPLGPTSAHPFGVDQLGHDVMSRVIYGTRVSLEVGIIGTGISTFIGVIVGLIAGFYRGWVDTRASRASIDVVLSIPLLLLGIGIGAACAVKGCLGGAIQPGLA